MDSEDRLINIKEAAAFLGLTVGTTYHKVSRQELPFVRLSRRCLRFRLSDLKAWIDSRAHMGCISKKNSSFSS